jgi:hypothetical protein
MPLQLVVAAAVVSAVVVVVVWLGVGLLQIQLV